MHKEEIREAEGIRCLLFQNLLTEGLIHGFSLRVGGVSAAPYNTLNLGSHVGDDLSAVRENRNRLAAVLGFRPGHVVAGQQVHGTEIVHVTAQHKGRGHLEWEDALPETDGLICTEPDIVLMAHAADCALLFFYDPQIRCIGLAHAGWRGTVAGMGPAMVRAMADLGCAPKNIRAAVSPAIGPCCYQVGSNVADQVQESYRAEVLIEKEGSLFLDLSRLHARQLQDAGILSQHIVRSKYCTCCHHELFFSYRASGGKTGRMAGVISLTSTGQAML